MALRMESVTVGEIGELVTADRFGMVTVRVSILDEASSAFIGLTCQIPVQYDLTQTVQAVHDRARSTLRAALALAMDHV